MNNLFKILLARHLPTKPIDSRPSHPHPKQPITTNQMNPNATAICHSPNAQQPLQTPTTPTQIPSCHLYITPATRLPQAEDRGEVFLKEKRLSAKERRRVTKKHKIK
jgi:hypothetical protein